MINFKKEGKGSKTLVFLHGWGGAWQSFAPIIGKLKSKYTVYALDLPGFGLSDLPKAYGLSDYVEQLGTFFEKEGIVKPILIGHSFGGQVAAKFAIEKGSLLSGVVLVDGAGVRRNDPQIRFNIAVAQFGKRIMSMTPFAYFYPAIRPWYYKVRGMENSDYFKATSNPTLQATASKIFREDLSDEFSKIVLPTLIFWGEKDPPELTPLEFGVKMHERIKGSKMVVVAGAGHFSYLDDQERFVTEINDFVSKL